MPTIYILLPVHNRKPTTLNFIDSLLTQDVPNWHLILIDDGSTDGTSEAVTEKAESLTIIRGDGNLWWAGALQKGIDYLKTTDTHIDDIILFVNDDTIMPPDFLRIGISHLSSTEKIIVKANVLCIVSNTVIERGLIFNPNRGTFKDASHSKDTNICSSNGLFIKWKDLLCIGDFRPKLLPHYLSDYEYTNRAHRKGYCIVDPEMLVLLWYQDKSGFRSFTEKKILNNLLNYFSKKSARNPIYWTIFFLFATSGNTLLKNLIKNWYSSSLEIIKILKNRPLEQKKKYRSG